MSYPTDINFRETNKKSKRRIYSKNPKCQTASLEKKNPLALLCLPLAIYWLFSVYNFGNIREKN